MGAAALPVFLHAPRPPLGQSWSQQRLLACCRCCLCSTCATTHPHRVRPRCRSDQTLGGQTPCPGSVARECYAPATTASSCATTQAPACPPSPPQRTPGRCGDTGGCVTPHPGQDRTVWGRDTRFVVSEMPRGKACYYTSWCALITIAVPPRRRRSKTGPLCSKVCFLFQQLRQCGRRFRTASWRWCGREAKNS